MAGVSMKDIKNRIRSMQSTRQITKAMEMVAASKLRSAQDRAISSRPYFETLYATMNDIADSTRDFSSPYLRPRKEGKLLCIVIAGDRGLAGGYNGNILRMAYREMQNADAEVLPIGKKAVEFFRMRGVPLVTERGGSRYDDRRLLLRRACALRQLFVRAIQSGASVLHTLCIPACADAEQPAAAAAACVRAENGRTFVHSL